MANQDLLKQMSTDGLGWVLEVFSRLADLPLTQHTLVHRYLCHSERDCIMKLDDSLALSHSSAQMPRQLPRQPREEQKPQQFVQRWASVYIRRILNRPHPGGRAGKLKDELANGQTIMAVMLLFRAARSSASSPFSLWRSASLLVFL